MKEAKMSETDLTGVNISTEVGNRYTVSNNTFIARGNNPLDMITAEVGDNQDNDIFQPQMKIKRWDNQANMSIRLLHNEVDTPVITTTVNGKINYDRQKFSIDFYEQPAQAIDGLEEGGYEFEITLKEKPASNVISFSIQTKGLNFYYQDALTAEEIALGHNRPDSVIGSYAVYYANDFVNIIGGRQYRTGKVGIIPKPKIVDSLGAETWGALNIDKQAGLLTVTIPQDFLDSATYPVHHAAGLTFGYTSVGSTTGGTCLNYIFAHPRYTPPSNGTAESIFTYFVNVVGGSKSTAGFYLAPSDPATSLVGGTAEHTNVINSWNELALSGEDVAAGTYYRIGIQVGVTDSRMKYDSGFGAGYKDYYVARTYTAGSMPDPFPAAASESGYQWSNYITYKPSLKNIFFWT